MKHFVLAYNDCKAGSILFDFINASNSVKKLFFIFADYQVSNVFTITFWVVHVIFTGAVEDSVCVIIIFLVFSESGLLKIKLNIIDLSFLSSGRILS